MGAVLSRLSGTVVKEDLQHFNLFIQMLGLTDLPLFGRRITWVQLNGKCIIFLDRVLVSHNWKAEWGIG